MAKTKLSRTDILRNLQQIHKSLTDLNFVNTDDTTNILDNVLDDTIKKLDNIIENI